MTVHHLILYNENPLTYFHFFLPYIWSSPVSIPICLTHMHSFTHLSTSLYLTILSLLATVFFTNHFLRDISRNSLNHLFRHPFQMLIFFNPFNDYKPKFQYQTLQSDLHHSLQQSFPHLFYQLTSIATLSNLLIFHLV